MEILDRGEGVGHFCRKGRDKGTGEDNCGLSAGQGSHNARS